MYIKTDVSLRYFNWWGGAKTNALEFTPKELDEIENYFEMMQGDKIPTETEINDLMWFYPQVYAKALGLEWDFEEGKLLRNTKDEIVKLNKEN